MDLRPTFHLQRSDMGLFKGLLGKDEEDGRGKAPPLKLGPQYQRLNRWIESRIGPMDPADPKLRTRLDNLLSKEMRNFPSAKGSLTFTKVRNDTIVRGDTRPFKGRLRSLGLAYDGKNKQWVAKNRTVTEADLDVPSELAGLKKYIESIPYRAQFGEK